MAKTFYITTPIYYVNDVPHIGHAYTSIAADALARYKRLAGFEVFFLTGTDEHGRKVAKTAEEMNKKPIELANQVVRRFQDLWTILKISNDEFVRTTEPRHKAAVHAIYRAVKKNDDIYLGNYEDWYCVPCETFWTENQLLQKKCPDCGREVEKVKEESYFFKMSKYQGALLKHIEENPDFIQPVTRRNEILSFVKEGLRDLSISRTTFSWGIPVPDDNRHIVYVWFDALTNYLTGSGYLADPEKFNKFWPADVHLIGKDILRFHAIYWPTFLLSAGLPLPKKVFAHGWWTVEGQKMSKTSKNAVDPVKLAEDYGVDALRYFLLREVPFGMDGDFSHKALIHRINSDLANDLGNLASRSLAMAIKYRAGLVKKPANFLEIDEKLKKTAGETVKKIDLSMNALAFHKALFSIWELIGMVNKYIDETAPWKLAQNNENDRLTTVLYNILESLRIIAILILPFMPSTAEKMWISLGIKKDLNEQRLSNIESWGELKEGTTISKIPPLFPRINV